MDEAVMTAVSQPTIRSLVKYANEEEIQRDEIVSILKERDQYVMVFYKKLKKRTK